jgi:hypothetical protein
LRGPNPGDQQDTHSLIRSFAFGRIVVAVTRFFPQHDTYRSEALDKASTSGSNLTRQTKYRPQAENDRDARSQDGRPQKGNNGSTTWLFHVVTFYWAARVRSGLRHFHFQSPL